MPTMVAIADLTGQPGSGDQDACQAHEDNPDVLAIAGTLRGSLAGMDIKVGILDVP